MTAIEQLLSARASAMAAHDGLAPGTVHFHGAANQLVAEILSARDQLIQALPLGGQPESPAPDAQDDQVQGATP